MRRKDYRDYFQDIFNSINEIESFIKNYDFENFAKDRKTINAVIRSIEVIGEASKKISKSFKDKYSFIPWNKMTGMRNKMIHEYFGIDLEILWKTVTKDIPSLKPFVQDILQREVETKK